MAITQDATATGSIDSAQELTFALTVANGATKLIVQAIFNTVPIEDIRRITYAGTNLTAAVIAKNNSVPTTIEIWYLDNPASGTNNVVVSTTGVGNIRATATSLFGAAASTPEDTDFLDDDGPNTTVTLTLTGTVGAWLFDAISSAANAVTPNDDQVQNLDFDAGLNRGSYHQDAVNTSTSMTWTYTSDVVGICAVRIAPAPSVSSLIIRGDGLTWQVTQ